MIILASAHAIHDRILTIPEGRPRRRRTLRAWVQQRRYDRKKSLQASMRRPSWCPHCCVCHGGVGPCPDPDEIRARCEEVQATWKPRLEIKRAGKTPVYSRKLAQWMGLEDVLIAPVFATTDDTRELTDN